MSKIATALLTCAFIGSGEPFVQFLAIPGPQLRTWRQELERREP
jgi:hypothetical protein